MKRWLVASYKINEHKKAQLNLANQNFNFYLPKITIKTINSNHKEEFLFPGYIFIYASTKNYSVINNTFGIKKIIRFGNYVSYITDDEIQYIKMLEETSKEKPVEKEIKIGQEAYISSGSLKGSIVKICSLPFKERVDIFLSILGATRRINISEKDITYI